VSSTLAILPGHRPPLSSSSTFGLAEAVELTLIYLDKEPARYERASLRLHARLCNEVRWGFEESLAALGLLAALRGPRVEEAAHTLASLLPITQEIPASVPGARPLGGRALDGGRG
jgi:hypothetical protein